jgi:hypothetical protein
VIRVLLAPTNNKQYTIKPVYISCRALSRCQQRAGTPDVPVSFRHSDQFYRVYCGPVPHAACQPTERDEWSLKTHFIASVAASNSVAATMRYGKTDLHATEAVTINFKPARKCSTKSLFTK